ncbi:MAG: hypothetical protein QOE14_991 [Humisphaera sp.]|nr:hypothetical protein [Humisphaera sp.]
MDDRKPTQTRRGFTLVELLVVIGIIAVLVGILLPTLASARRSATSVKCLANLKQMGDLFLMYAGDHKNTFPVSRQDLPEVNGVPQNLLPSQGGLNYYWCDMLYMYAKRNAKPLNDPTVSQADLDSWRKSIFWCPTWEADHPNIAATPALYNERFKTGYAMNALWAYRPDFPATGNLPSVRIAQRSVAVWIGGAGRYYKKNEISNQPERILVADTNCWTIGLQQTNAAGDLAGQGVGNAGWAALEDGASPPGATNLDYYRHGKYPSNDGTRFNTKGGKVACNVLYGDGHCSTLQGRADGYKGIRMRYP